MKSEIDIIGERAGEFLDAIAKSKKVIKANRDHLPSKEAKLRPLLKQVWDALDKGVAVNGFDTKTAWAAHNKVSARYCQYIVNGRKARTGEHRNRAVPLKVGLLASIDGTKFEFTEGMVAAVKGMIEEPKKPVEEPKKEEEPTALPTYEELFDKETKGEKMTRAERSALADHRRKRQIGAAEKKERKTHAVAPDKHGHNRRTWCSKWLEGEHKIQNIVLAPEGEEPSCGLCLSAIDSVKRDAEYREFEATVPTNATKKDRDQLWREWLDKKTAERWAADGYDWDPKTLTATPKEEMRPAAEEQKPTLDVIVKDVTVCDANEEAV